MRDESKEDMWKEAKMPFVKNWKAAETERFVALVSEDFQFHFCP